MNQIKTLIIAALALSISTVSAQWTEVEWEQTHGLSLIDFVDDEIGYAFMHELQGFYSGLGRTEDGGQTWTDMELANLGYSIQALDFFGEGAGVVIIRDWESTEAVTQIYQTLNNGETWENISPAVTATGYGIADVQFFDAMTGFFVVAENMYATTDGGDTWIETILPSTAISINFSDVNHGIIGTWDGSFNYFGGMICTTDGGATWNEIVLENTNSVIGAVKQFNETTAYAAPVKWGASGQHEFYKTTDNGESWTPVALPETDDDATLSGIDFWEENHGVVTLSANEAFYIYETTNAGETWELQNQFGQFYITDLTLTETSGYIVGGGGMIYRLDAPVGLFEYDEVAVTLYPNPANVGQSIQWESHVDFTEIRIIDITGKTVFQENLNAQKATIPNLNSGVYFVSLQNKLTNVVVKILVD